MLLLALAWTGNFEIGVEDWPGETGEGTTTGPEMVGLPAAKVFRIYGAEEEDENGCTQPQAVGEELRLPGGHHFGKDYPSLTKKMLQTARGRENAFDA